MQRVPCARLLRSFSSETFPSIILAGPEGAGKRSLLRAFFRHIFGKESAYASHRVAVQVNASKTLDVQFLENNECIEVLVKPYGHSDKKVLQHLARDLSQTKSIRGLLSGKKEERVKVLVIPDGESLSLGAQMALRRIMEAGASNFRIILLTTGVSSFIAPFRSRFLICRVPSLSRREMQHTMQGILQKEGIENTPQNFIGEVARTSRGNMRRALALLESTAISQKPVTCLDWEKDAADLATNIFDCASVSGLPAIRAATMSILEKGVDCTALLCFLADSFVGREADAEVAREVAEQAAKYSTRISGGTRDLFHLEAFSIHAILAHIQNKQTQAQ